MTRHFHLAPVAFDYGIVGHNTKYFSNCDTTKSIIKNLAHCIGNQSAILSAAVASSPFSSPDIHDKNLICRENLAVQVRKFAGDLAFICISTQIYYTGRDGFVLINL